MGYILSVVIPTRNRLKYLKGCLNSIHMMNRNDVEVIVQDNSENHREVQAFVLSLDDKNIKYYYCGKKLSQTENSDLAFSHITGKYAVYIGDDDTICKSMIDLAYAMDEHSIESATYGISTYNWPDLVKSVPSLFTLKYFSYDVISIEKIDSKAILKESLKTGVQDISRLPRVYHGIVSRKLLYRVFQKTNGSFFPGPSPDMANAISCAALARNQVHINIPMIISGFGKSSAGGMGKRNLHKGSLKGNFQLRDDVEDSWDEKIPKRWMQSTIWPNSATTALKSINKSNYLKKMNYGIIASESFLHDKSSILCLLSPRLSVREYAIFVKHTFSRVINRVFKNNQTKNYNERIITTTMSIEKAVEYQNRENGKFDVIKAFDDFFNDSLGMDKQ